MIYHGQKTSTTPGTAVPLTSARHMVSFLTVFPLAANQGEVRLGGNPQNAENAALNGGASAAIASGHGAPLTAGSATVAWPMMAVTPVDLNTVYIDVDNSGDGVQFIFGRP